MHPKYLILLSGLVFLTFSSLFLFQPQSKEVTGSASPQTVQFESALIHQTDLLISHPLTGFQFFSQGAFKTFSQQLAASLSQFHVVQSSLAISRSHHHRWVSLLGTFYKKRLYLKYRVLIQ